MNAAVMNRVLDTTIETSDLGSRRLLEAIGAGDHNFVITSEDGRVSAKIRLRKVSPTQTQHSIAGTTLSIDWREATASNGRVRTSLSRTELRLLAALLVSPDRPVTRAELVERVWPDQELPVAERENALSVYMCCVRKRLLALGIDNAVVTVRGSGYRVVATDGAET